VQSAEVTMSESLIRHPFTGDDRLLFGSAIHNYFTLLLAIKVIINTLTRTQPNVRDMAGKRKREVTSPVSPRPVPVAAVSSKPAEEEGVRDKKRRKADDVMVVWQLADGSRRYERRLGECGRSHSV